MYTVFIESVIKDCLQSSMSQPNTADPPCFISFRFACQHEENILKTRNVCAVKTTKVMVSQQPAQSIPQWFLKTLRSCVCITGLWKARLNYNDVLLKSRVVSQVALDATCCQHSLQQTKANGVLDLLETEQENLSACHSFQNMQLKRPCSGTQFTQGLGLMFYIDSEMIAAAPKQTRWISGCVTSEIGVTAK